MSPAAWDERKVLCMREGAVVGTSSMRRMAQLRLVRRDLIVEPLWGNVNTRVRRLREGRFAAIVMAAAAIRRIDLDVDDLMCVQLDTDIFIPAPDQGALGLQVREGDAVTLHAVAPLNHPGTEGAVSAERAFLRHFGGGCHILLGAPAEIEADGALPLRGIVAATDGSGVCFISHRGDVQPCGYLPRVVGNVLRDGFKNIWENSELLLALRDTDRIFGKCGACGFRTVCGGCRARAYYATGGYLDEETYCMYDPKGKG